MITDLHETLSDSESRKHEFEQYGKDYKVAKNVESGVLGESGRVQLSKVEINEGISSEMEFRLFWAKLHL